MSVVQQPIPHSDDETAQAVRRQFGALILPAARTKSSPPTVDLTQALPIPRRGCMPPVERAYTAAHSSRFEWGEAA